MKNNKKGFTLVELLAVIVILGILLLVAVPGIQTVISNSRKKTFKDNLALVANTVNSLKLIDDTRNCYYYFNGDSTSSQAGYVSVERGSLKGISGLIKVDSNGEVNLIYAVDKNNGFKLGNKPKIESSGSTYSIEAAVASQPLSYTPVIQIPDASVTSGSVTALTMGDATADLNESIFYDINNKLSCGF